MNKIVFIIFILLFLLFTEGAVFAIQTDTFIEERLSGKIFKKPEEHLFYNYENTDKVIIPLQITKTIASSGKYETYEGDIVEFTVKENVFYKGNLFVKKGTKVSARVDIVLKKGISGIPGEIHLSDFNIPDINKGQIIEPVEKCGQNRMLWILPLKFVLTFLPPSGSFTNIIFGGDAKIKPKNTLKLTVYPNWI